MKVFISHSSRDAEVAQLLIDLLRLALNLRSEDIRCSSIEGYRLPGGASTNEVLRQEVHEAQLFLGLITPRSIASAYVLFELGARWGAGKTLIPLLASGASSQHLKGPLSSINALDCSVPGQVHQMLEESAHHLGIRLTGASAYQKVLSALVEASSSNDATQQASDLVDNSSDKRPVSTVSDAEERLMLLLASDSVDSDKEIAILRLPGILEIPKVKVSVLITDLMAKGLVGHLSGSGRFVGLTDEGVRHLIERGLL